MNSLRGKLQVFYKKYRSETVRWTITSVEVSPDLRYATVAYSVIGEDVHVRQAQKFFNKHAGEIRKHVSKFVILNIHLDYNS